MLVYEIESMRLLAVNESMVRTYGYAESELLSMTLRDLHLPEDFQDLEANIAQVSEGVDEAGIWRHVDKSGRILHAEIFSEVLEYEGKRCELVVAIDRTAEVEAKKRADAEKALLDVASKLGHFGAWAVDLPQLDHHWSSEARKIHGVGPDFQPDLETLIRFYVPEHRERVRKVFTEVGQSGTPFDEEFQMKRPDGSMIWVRVIAAAIQDEHGNVVRINGAIQDITADKRREEYELRLQRMQSIGTLAGGIAHDLNNLMAPVMMGTGLLKELDPNPQASQILDEIERNVRRSSDLVRQVLTFARGTSGERKRVAVAELVKDLESIVRSTFPKNIEFLVEGLDDIPDILGDATQIHQVLVNLCVNARDAMADEGGQLSLRFSLRSVDKLYLAGNPEAREGDFIRIDVCDTGCGMVGDVKARAFEPFYTTKAFGEGTGLGLSTSMGIIRSHGGFMNVYSEPGKGSEFQVYLPLFVESGESEDDLVNVESSCTSPRGSGERILLVDDEDSILNTMAMTLQTFGYEVITASDGIEALAEYARQMGSIDMVITDLMMPNMDGPTLIAAVKRIHPDLPIIAASGLEANGRYLKATQLGVRFFVSKPCSAQELLHAVAKALGK